MPKTAPTLLASLVLGQQGAAFPFLVWKCPSWNGSRLRGWPTHQRTGHLGSWIWHCPPTKAVGLGSGSHGGLKLGLSGAELAGTLETKRDHPKSGSGGGGSPGAADFLAPVPG